MTRSHAQSLYRIGWSFVVALSIAAYVSALRGRLVWDDLDLVWNPNEPGGGSAVGGGDSFLHCFTRPFLWNYYRPLVSASFYVEHQVWDRNPLPYHITNILLHAIATAMLVPLVREAFGRRLVALAAALIYAVHPVHVAAIAWIGGRTDALCCLWAIVFGLGLVRAARTERGPRVRWLAVALTAYLLALFTKEQMLAAMPLAPLAFACFHPPGRPHGRWTGWLAAIPFVIAAGAFAYIGSHLGMPHIPAPRADRVTQLAMAGWTWLHYGLLLGAPAPRLLNTYSLGGYERTGWIGAGAGWAVALCACAALIWWMRTHRPSAWFATWSLLLILPVINLVPMWFLLLSPYRAGLTSIGVCALLGRLAVVEVVRPSWLRGALRFAIAALAVWSTGLTISGIEAWQSDEVLFQTITQDDPDSILGHYMLTRILQATGRERESIPHVEAMLRWLYHSDAWTRPPEAVRLGLTDRQVRWRVLQHQGGVRDPKHFLATLFAQLGHARMRTGDLAAAQPLFETGKSLDPASPDPDVGLGYLAYRRGDYAAAERWLLAAVRATPPRLDAHVMLAQLYEIQGRTDEARRQRELAGPLAQ